LSAATSDVALELGPVELDALRRESRPHAILDVREPWELDICKIADSLAVPLGSLPQNLDRIPKSDPLVVMCHHGGRSMQAVMWLRAQGYANAVNLRGGIHEWAQQVEPTMATY
jgi:rhodanese-related sulfurtransferase